MQTFELTSTLELTFTQCKKLISAGFELSELLYRLNDQPDWLVFMSRIDSIEEIASILEGGCASGAYMPAVTYHTANKCVNEHGEDMLEYIHNKCDLKLKDLVTDKVETFNDLNTTICSMCVENWCYSFSSVIEILKDTL